MTQFKFGLTWIIAVTIIFAAVYLNLVPVPQMTDISTGVSLLFILLEGIGVYCTVSGLTVVSKEKRTAKMGTRTFGRILDISATDNVVGSVPELIASIVVYVPTINKVYLFEENIGKGPSKYDVGMYVVVKQYEDNVSILEITEKEKIPQSVVTMINNGNFKEDNFIDENGEVVKNIGFAGIYDNSRYIKTFTNADW